ncbi:hypothetical protein SK128_015817, partial [Halocaridina rubra]
PLREHTRSVLCRSHARINRVGWRQALHELPENIWQHENCPNLLAASGIYTSNK